MFIVFLLYFYSFFVTEKDKIIKYYTILEMFSFFSFLQKLYLEYRGKQSNYKELHVYTCTKQDLGLL